MGTKLVFSFPSMHLGLIKVIGSNIDKEEDFLPTARM